MVIVEVETTFSKAYAAALTKSMVLSLQLQGSRRFHSNLP